MSFNSCLTENGCKSRTLQSFLLVRSTVRYFKFQVMRTNKKEGVEPICRPDVRSIKIQPRYRENVYSTVHVPEIRLSGVWLEKLGFSEGRRVIITMMNELLIVRLLPQ